MKRAPDLTFPPKDEPLRQDVRLLGRILGSILRSLEGRELYDVVETARIAARDRRDGLDSASDRLQSTLRGLAPEQSMELVRAFSTYFQLVNMAERVHRIRRRRAYMRADGWPQPGSINAVVADLANRGIDGSAMARLLERTVISPVFTAHPTEATRRTLLVKEQRIARALVKRIDPGLLLSREEEAELEKIRHEVALGWQTEEHAEDRPTVADEVEHVVFYLSEVIYRVVPAFFDELELALATHYGPEFAARCPKPRLRFGSWVGGDMDGNPNVGADTIRASLARHRDLVLQRYRRELVNLIDHFSQSSTRIDVGDGVHARLEELRRELPELADSIPARYRKMPYRMLLWHVARKLELTEADDARGYASLDDFRADLALTDRSIKSTGGEGRELLQRLICRVETFGFHLATLDIRQDSMVHRRVAALLLGEDENWDREARLAVLQAGPQALPEAKRTEDPMVAATLETFRAIDDSLKRYGTEAIGPYIISMAQGPDDVLAVLFLAETAGLVGSDGSVPLDVAPLFETVPDLRDGAATLEAILSNARYRAHLARRGDIQYVMLGYSDSSKESGVASSRWALQVAQQELLAVADAHGVELVLFHGRGGTVSRGGSKPRGAILAEPPGAVRGKLRVTEQGEIIHSKYGLRDIALRTLELTTGAVLEASARSGNVIPDDFKVAMEKVATSSRRAFRDLVFESPEFYDYFRGATPIDVIERLRIGSRPAARRSKQGIENLRAIPWVFSWTQSRHLLTAWYGVGSGLDELIAAIGIEEAREMARRWRFFGNMLSDVEMVLAKTDLDIAARYRDLAGESGKVIFPKVADEFERTRRRICELKGVDELLDKDRVLQRAIRLRNPYVDPMSLLQVDLLERWRATNREDQALERALVATVQGISRGLQNTG